METNNKPFKFLEINFVFLMFSKKLQEHAGIRLQSIFSLHLEFLQRWINACENEVTFYYFQSLRGNSGIIEVRSSKMRCEEVITSTAMMCVIITLIWILDDRMCQTCYCLKMHMIFKISINFILLYFTASREKNNLSFVHKTILKIILMLKLK